MSRVAASLFSRVQGADFYRGMHREAVGLLPSGAGRRWLDVGCGPGVLAREAAARGYSVRGIDRDGDMIARARQLAMERGSSVDFAIEELDAETNERFDVVSASSLLVVLPDPGAALLRLLDRAKPGGTALIVEASVNMSLAGALRLLSSGGIGRRCRSRSLANRDCACVGTFSSPIWRMCG